MIPPNFREKLSKLSDADLIDVLDAVSEEVKKRNNISGLGLKSISENSFEENTKIIMEAIKNLGIEIKNRQ